MTDAAATKDGGAMVDLEKLLVYIECVPSDGSYDRASVPRNDLKILAQALRESRELVIDLKIARAEMAEMIEAMPGWIAGEPAESYCQRMAAWHEAARRLISQHGVGK